MGDDGYARECETDDGRPVLVVRSGNVLINYFADGDDAAAAHASSGWRRKDRESSTRLRRASIDMDTKVTGDNLRAEHLVARPLDNKTFRRVDFDAGTHVLDDEGDLTLSLVNPTQMAEEARDVYSAATDVLASEAVAPAATHAAAATPEATLDSMCTSCMLDPRGARSTSNAGVADGPTTPLRDSSRFQFPDWKPGLGDRLGSDDRPGTGESSHSLASRALVATQSLSREQMMAQATGRQGSFGPQSASLGSVISGIAEVRGDCTAGDPREWLASPRLEGRQQSPLSMARGMSSQASLAKSSPLVLAGHATIAQAPTFIGRDVTAHTSYATVQSTDAAPSALGTEQHQMSQGKPCLSQDAAGPWGQASLSRVGDNAITIVTAAFRAAADAVDTLDEWDGWKALRDELSGGPPPMRQTYCWPTNNALVNRTSYGQVQSPGAATNAAGAAVGDEKSDQPSRKGETVDTHVPARPWSPAAARAYSQTASTPVFVQSSGERSARDAALTRMREQAEQLQRRLDALRRRAVRI